MKPNYIFAKVSICKFTRVLSHYPRQNNQQGEDDEEELVCSAAAVSLPLAAHITARIHLAGPWTARFGATDGFS
jgi:hypothetical protein